jgi:hypothetical protein
MTDFSYEASTRLEGSRILSVKKLSQDPSSQLFKLRREE